MPLVGIRLILSGETYRKARVGNERLGPLWSARSWKGSPSDVTGPDHPIGTGLRFRIVIFCGLLEMSGVSFVPISDLGINKCCSVVESTETGFGFDFFFGFLPLDWMLPSGSGSPKKCHRFAIIVPQKSRSSSKLLTLVLTEAAGVLLVAG